jgi:hypothetical protein
VFGVGISMFFPPTVPFSVLYNATAASLKPEKNKNCSVATPPMSHCPDIICHHVLFEHDVHVLYYYMALHLGLYTAELT